MNSQQLRPYFLLALLGGTLVLAFFIFKPFLTPLALAAVFAVVLQSVYRRIAVFLRSPSAAAFVTVLIAVLLILVPLVAVGTLVGVQAQELISSLDGAGSRAQLTAALAKAEEVLSPFIPGMQFADTASVNIDLYVRQGVQWLMDHLGTIFSGVASLVLNLFLFFVALYYLLRDGKNVKRTVIELSPLSDRDDELVFDKLELAVNSVIKGNLTIAFIQGVLTALGFTLFGVPQAVLWGAVAAIAALIPGVGTSLVFIPAVLFLFLTGSAGGGFGLLVWGVVAVGLIDNILGPRIVGGKLNLHPLLILLSVLGGLMFWGPVGIFLGPLSLSLLFAFLSIYADVSKRAA